VEDPIEGVVGRFVESISRRIESTNRADISFSDKTTSEYSLPVHQVKRINLCSSMTMSSDTLDVSK
jgi:hypothetical protein